MSTDWPEGVGQVILSEVDSTMAEAARRAPNTASPMWIFSHQQSSPKGRRGRVWVQPAGTFSATLLLPPDLPPDRQALRSFVAALALYDALVEVSGREDLLALKWPNDVLLGGGKLAGILLESYGSRHLAIGIGVNLASAPTPDQVEAQAVAPVSLAQATGTVIAPEDFLPYLANHFAKYDAQFTTYGFAPIRTAWLARAARLGEVVTARTLRDDTKGTFETVDETGQLVLSTAKGRVTIPAADVYF